jgi:DNA recombination protein RmuC
LDPVTILIVIVVLLAGLGLGWFLGGRPVAAMRGERDEYLDKFRAAVTDLAAERKTAERVGSLEVELRAERQRAEQLGALVAGHERGEAERTRAHEAQLAQLRDMEAKLNAQFGELATKALNEAQTHFLKRADERFTQAGEKSEAQLKSLLQPVETTLKRYEEGLAKVEKDRVGSYGELKAAVAQLTQGNADVRRETQRLANVMRSSPKARGRWGEEQLRTILESSGLAENVDFSLQGSVSDGERQLRPDCVINLPGGRCIVVDVKCPLVAFEQAYDEEDEGRRADLLLQHANAMKSYANDLGRKGYWRQFDLSPDFVIMFIPGEHFLSAAAERAPDLIETAYRNGVIIASTINMLALAKVMAGMWRQESLAAQAKEIAEAGKELYRRLSTMGNHVAKLGRNLTLASGAYNDMVGSLESQVMTQARRFETLKVETGGKAIEPLPLADTSIRPLTKLVARDEASEAAE